MVCIFANGRYDERIDLSKCDRIVAVDGGANFLRSKNIVPDVFVGDADSVSEETMEWLKKHGVMMKLFPEEKDEIDLELALQQFESEEKIVFGWQGDRLDMILALFYLLKRFKNTVLESENLTIGYVEGKKVLFARPGEKWSILPLGADAEGVSLRGFKYTLEDAKMPVVKPYGVSNEAVSSEVEIEVKKGGVIFFRWKREPL
ncbi:MULTISPECIES: thiamine diphosphokinase [Thermotoga]|jgi:thiamine pyrophosphokinase|uniref:Thiamine diphosphokinase n=1 Tax=Thermotoga neapolitana (strain ATCC 49049 / DSM 4359 / NBRC 107923 / NS-E) TaxID=309803 RepID=B9KA81_THENN|nr:MULTISPECIES: thiamine diphosphokinase [Thermotoga]MDK2786032.1 thiamine pyrophosphokinae [Thermotoga sp.]HBF10722.1 thiamine diphosphokinase [Thermotoga neapolitana]ACM23865.1 Thiamine pyrophosphokinase [Thermotoga neapolitana DSM 4359]AJG39894.1 thiamine pyrophosphokinase [Thermotoga sp. RQ7]KFZ21057.1 thiamine pyrophosphokinase [Thermotoga neapolitana LA10]